MPAPKYNPHYMLADYQVWEGSWELWNGVAVAMTPSPFGRHQKALTKLAQVILNALEASGCKECEVAVELDWIIAEDTVVRPDLSLCCGDNIDRFIESPPVLVAEVLSDSTANKDRTAKRRLYADQGVRYYLMVDTDHDRLDFLHLVNDRYEQVDTFREAKLELTQTCSIRLNFSDFCKSLISSK
ncbi:MAG: Uma2 family endonuclease [Pirellula sp.]